jgi:ketosteroid isomerase-like protein
VSRENVEIVRGTLDAAKRGDWEAVAATLDPNILVRADAHWPESCVFGRQAVISWYQANAGESDIEEEEITDLGDRLLVRQRWRLHGRYSGVELDRHLTTITTFRAGRAILIEYFLDHAEALKAVGLEG